MTQKRGPIMVETTQPPNEGLPRVTPVSDLPQPVRVEPTTSEQLEAIRFVLEANQRLLAQMLGSLDAIRKEVAGK